MTTSASPRLVGDFLTGTSNRVRQIPLEFWLVAGLTLVAGVLRFATIARQSYWLDEATTVHEMRLSFGAMLHSVRVNETTPPLYFVISWLWARLFGTSELGLRSLSAIAGTALVPVVYLCGRQLISRRAGVVASAFAVFCPFLIWYSQEARSYMLFALLAGGSFLCFARALHRPTAGNLALWAACSSLAMLTHFFAGFLVAPEAIWMIWAERRRATVVAVAVTAAVQLAILPLAIGDTTHPLSWIQAFPLSTRIEQLPIGLWLGTLYQSSLVSWALPITAAVIGVVIVVTIIGADSAELRGALIAGAVTAFVVLVPLALALVGSDYVVIRNFIPAWIPMAILAGGALTARRARRVGAVLAAATLVAFVWAQARIDANPAYQRPNWRGVVAALGHVSVPRGIVLYDGAFAAAPLAIYMPGIAWTGPGGQDPQPGNASVSIDELDIVGSAYDRPVAPLPFGARMIASHRVDGYVVDRYALPAPWTLPRSEIVARAQHIVVPAPAGPFMLVQLPSHHVA
jgi:mannosyltransferase